MGCGKSAAADRDNDAMRLKYDEECRQLVQEFDETELGRIIFDLHSYFRHIVAREKQTTQGFKIVEDFLQRLKADA